MDPNECLRMMLDALRDGEGEQAAVYAAALQGWLSAGGFAPKDPRLDRTLKTKVIEQEGSIAVHIDVAGWRVDVHLGEDSDTRPSHHMVNIANVAVDGDDAGWCACAYDSTVEPTTAPLALDGSECA